MKIEAAQGIGKLVKAMYPFLSVGKLLYISLDVHYMCFPTAVDKANRTRAIEKKLGIHYIFSRTEKYTKILRCIKENAFFILDKDVFFLISYHGNCWQNDDLKIDLSEIDQHAVIELSLRFKKQYNREISYAEIIGETKVWVQNIKILHGLMRGTGKEEREYRVEINGETLNFLQSKNK